MKFITVVFRDNLKDGYTPGTFIRIFIFKKFHYFLEAIMLTIEASMVFP